MNKDDEEPIDAARLELIIDSLRHTSLERSLNMALKIAKMQKQEKLLTDLLQELCLEYALQLDSKSDLWVLKRQILRYETELYNDDKEKAKAFMLELLDLEQRFLNRLEYMHANKRTECLKVRFENVLLGFCFEHKWENYAFIAVAFLVFGVALESLRPVSYRVFAGSEFLLQNMMLVLFLLYPAGALLIEMGKLVRNGKRIAKARSDRQEPFFFVPVDVLGFVSKRLLLSAISTLVSVLLLSGVIIGFTL